MKPQADFAPTPAAVSLPGDYLPRRITREARLYALRELARRAGVSREFFLTWKIEVAEERTLVRLDAGGCRHICFAHAPDKPYSRIATQELPVGRAGWLRPPFGNSPPEDLLIPFSRGDTTPGMPLFVPANNGSFVCHEDLLLSLVFTLSRVEETLCSQRDEHGRFPASASMAARHGFLERPILDEYGLAFEQALSALLPSWKASRAPLRVKLTHDIDGVGIPLVLRTCAGHTIKRRRPSASFRDLAAALTPIEPAELTSVRELARISRARRLHSAFFWKGSPRTAMDEGYDPFHPKVQRVIEDLREAGCELGAHPGYFTFGSRLELDREVQRLRKALGVNHLGGRQHYLRWSPETWLDWEACGLLYDSTVGYADRLGFRAGTSIPFRPWSLEQNRELRLIEVPLILMDCTPVKYMRISKEEATRRIRACITRTAAVGGVFTVLWHNFPLLDPEYEGWYEPILSMLSGAAPFTVPPDVEALW